MSALSVRTLVASFLALTVLATPLDPARAHDGTEEPVIVFSGGGWGHGVGMSQYGAMGRADAGHSHAEILAFYYHGSTLATHSPAAPLVPDTVRVRLARPSSETITPTGTMTVSVADALAPVAVNEAVTVTRTGTAWQLTLAGGATLCGPDGCGGPSSVVTVDFAPGDSTQTVTVGSTGRQYGRGRIEISDTGLAAEMWVVVGNLSMDEYLYGLGEVPSSWPAAALRAQAVAGRSYATAKINQRPHNGTWCSASSAPVTVCPFDVYASTQDQAYVGWSKEAESLGPSWRAAVNETTGQVVTVDGAVVSTFYSSSNGGHTASSREIWGGDHPYLAAKPDPFNAALGPDGSPRNPVHSWERRYRVSDLTQWLSADSRTDVGNVISIAVVGSPSESGRLGATDVRIVGSERTVTVTGSVLRSVINQGAPGSVSSPSTSQDLLTTKYSVTSFTDVPANAYYALPVQWMVANSITTGIGEGRFGPDQPNTRGQAATFLWRFSDRPTIALPGPFSDVPADSYFEMPVAWMAQRGITTGVDPTHFEPGGTVTRAQAATFLWRLAGRPTVDGSTPFNDVEPGRFYTEAVEWMVAWGITTGTTPTTFDPDAAITRGQLATFLWRLAGNPGAFEPGVTLPSSMRAQ